MDGSSVKSTDAHSSLGLDSRHPQGGSQPSETPVPGDLHRHQAHKTLMHITQDRIPCYFFNEIPVYVSLNPNENLERVES